MPSSYPAAGPWLAEVCPVACDGLLVPPEAILAAALHAALATVIGVDIDKAIALLHHACVCRHDIKAISIDAGTLLQSGNLAAIPPAHSA